MRMKKFIFFSVPTLVEKVKNNGEERNLLREAKKCPISTVWSVTTQ
jgi:hypothetical protein